MNNIKILLLTLISFTLIIGISQCKKKQSFPDVPEIKLLGFQSLIENGQTIPQRGVLVFSYTDGDGNIGLKQADTVGIYGKDTDYYYNLWITYEELQQGQWKEVLIINPQTLDTSFLHSRIPMLTPHLTGKSIHGEIYDTLPIYNPTSDYDTMRFKVRLIDRSLNHSNQIQTPMIIRPSS